MAIRTYRAFLIRDADGAAGDCFGVVFPDLPGCVTQGDTPQQAAEMAREALALHVWSMAAHREALPDPSPPGAVPDWLDATETEIVANFPVPVDPVA